VREAGGVTASALFSWRTLPVSAQIMIEAFLTAHREDELIIQKIINKQQKIPARAFKVPMDSPFQIL
jgi:hypothetical protein